MTKKVNEMSSEEIKDAVRDAYAGLANKSASTCDDGSCGPQTTQSSCCGPSTKAQTNPEEK